MTKQEEVLTSTFSPTCPRRVRLNSYLWNSDRSLVHRTRDVEEYVSGVTPDPLPVNHCSPTCPASLGEELRNMSPVTTTALLVHPRPKVDEESLWGGTSTLIVYRYW